LFKVETGTTPSTKEPSYWDGGNINWFTPMDLSKLNGEVLIEESERKITRKALEKCNLTLMPKGSIIISTRAPVGYVAVLGQEGTFNQGCKGLIPKSVEKVHTLFYAYYLLRQKQKLENLSGGSTFKELSKTMLENFEVPCPPPEEQKMVVEVLTSVDLAIKKVDEAIAQAERLKKGLMQQLLTKGIGHTEFKETEIGKIPKTWELKELKDVAKVVSGFTFPLELQGKNRGKYPYVKVGDLNKFHKYVISADNYVDEDDIEKLNGRPFPKGTIIFPKIGMAMRLNRYRILGTDALFDNNVAGLIPKGIETEFLYYYLICKVDLIKLAGTTTVPSITKNKLESLKIPFPQLSEQQKIAEILRSVDSVLQLKKEKKERLVRMKHKLMDLLLTGRVRVSL